MRWIKSTFARGLIYFKIENQAQKMTKNIRFAKFILEIINTDTKFLNFFLIFNFNESLHLVMKYNAIFGHNFNK